MGRVNTNDSHDSYPYTQETSKSLYNSNFWLCTFSSNMCPWIKLCLDLTTLSCHVCKTSRLSGCTVQLWQNSWKPESCQQSCVCCNVRDKWKWWIKALFLLHVLHVSTGPAVSLGFMTHENTGDLPRSHTSLYWLSTVQPSSPVQLWAGHL